MATRNPPVIPAQGQAPNNLPVPFVIDDAKRVIKVRNRGDNDYRRNNPQIYTDQRSISPGHQHTDPIFFAFKQLCEANVKFAPDPHNINFIPRAKFDEIMTPWMVLQIVQRLQDYQNLPPDTQRSLAKDVYYGSSDGRRPPSRRLLAALIATPDSYGPRPVESFSILVREGISDNCLPLSRNDSTETLYCESHSCVHPSINELGSVPSQFRKDFTSWSRALTTPFIVWDEKDLHNPTRRHRHYVMKGGGPLPTMWTSAPAHTGGFGRVWKVKIDPQDRRFKSHPQEQGYFALKLLNQSSDTSTLDKEFDMEVRSLIFAESRAESLLKDERGDTETKEHLIQLLATFEVHNTRNGPPDYYLLFPWADGNLEDLWSQEDHQRNPMDKMQLAFMVDQFYYLAKALKCVHNDRQKIAINTGTDGRLFGRHGDITPKNFLIFRNVLDTRVHWMGLRIVLADFGLGRLHSEVSRSKDDGGNIANTASFAAPEYEIDGSSLSPKSDIFSLGCVFLLYIVWLFDGFENGVRKFSQQRKDEKDYHYGDRWELDNFWVNTKSKERAGLKETVKSRLDDLKDRLNCVEVVGEILTLIEHRMLRIDQKDRFRAGRLVLELDRIRQKWKRADSLYGTRAWRDSDLSKQCNSDDSTELKLTSVAEGITRFFEGPLPKYRQPRRCSTFPPFPALLWDHSTRKPNFAVSMRIQKPGLSGSTRGRLSRKRYRTYKGLHGRHPRKQRPSKTEVSNRKKQRGR